MGKVMYMRKGESHSVPFACDPVFANNDWAKIVEACQKRRVPDTWTVGSQKAMMINGTSYMIDIIGRDHDNYSDGSGKAPLTFQMHDCYGVTYKINDSKTTSGGWTNCVMRQTHLPAIMALMPSEVKSCIKEVNKLSTAGDLSSAVNTTKDKLFLLSEIEVVGSSLIGSYVGEGRQYAYYAAGNSRIKRLSGTNSDWWLRSPTQYANAFSFINYNGTNTYGYTNKSYGVALAFCF